MTTIPLLTAAYRGCPPLFSSPFRRMCLLTKGGTLVLSWPSGRRFCARFCVACFRMTRFFSRFALPATGPPRRRGRRSVLSAITVLHVSFLKVGTLACICFVLLCLFLPGFRNEITSMTPFYRFAWCGQADYETRPGCFAHSCFAPIAEGKCFVPPSSPSFTFSMRF